MATKEDVQRALNLFEREERVEGITHFDLRRPCSLCPNVVALVDGKTLEGPWAYMCVVCFSRFGVGLGSGLGQVMLWGKEPRLRGDFI